MKVTLGKNYILRQESANMYTLFNAYSALEYKISKELYFILKIFKYNVLGKKEVYNYLKQNKIDFYIDDFEKLLNKPDLIDLLVESNYPYSKGEDNGRDSSLPSFVKNTPSRIDLLLTERCNLKCKHCFQESSPCSEKDFASSDKLIKLFDEFEELNIQALKISGGEPLLHPEIEILFEYLSRKKYAKVILSNGILITDRILEIVKGKNFIFTISLDGNTEATHEFLRGKNTFQKTIKVLKKLSQHNIPFSITTTVNKFTYKNIRDICLYVNSEFKIRKHGINLLLPIGRGSDSNSLCLTEQEVKFVKKEVSELNDLIGDSGNIYVNDDSELYNIESNCDKIYCSAGTNIVALSPQLSVYPCVYGIGKEDYEMGQIGEEKLIDIWRKSDWYPFRGKVKLEDLSACSSCEFNSRCGLKDCRLKPVSQGESFFSAVSYCKKNRTNLN